MEIIKTMSLFIVTALAEIIGCYLPYLCLKEGKPLWLLFPAVISLALFVWLLTLHPQAAGRVYAAYGGVYICVALMWLWGIDAVRPAITDWIGVGICLTGVIFIMFGTQVIKPA
ncbi:YnfA family protein [Nitrosomonas ureae]|uniref:Small multidrug resistance family-3 protein n=1 Tax=Nitrosomonas ureae TaxID=44577 RepID=A0A1H5WUK8_9PROT|nr:YnfA family protein [Nitrosomonas ureae]SEG03182.1 small multidrug resistance family-3 protein [Nitrosomonas ureae]